MADLPPAERFWCCFVCGTTTPWFKDQCENVACCTSRRESDTLRDFDSAALPRSGLNREDTDG